MIYSYFSMLSKKKQERELEFGKGQSCMSTLFNFYAEYIMQNAEPDEAQAGTNIAGRNINNLRYADDTTLMAESEEEPFDEGEREE